MTFSKSLSCVWPSNKTTVAAVLHLFKHTKSTRLNCEWSNVKDEVKTFVCGCEDFVNNILTWDHAVSWTWLQTCWRPELRPIRRSFLHWPSKSRDKSKWPHYNRIDTVITVSRSQEIRVGPTADLLYCVIISFPTSPATVHSLLTAPKKLLLWGHSQPLWNWSLYIPWQLPSAPVISVMGGRTSRWLLSIPYTIIPTPTFDQGRNKNSLWSVSLRVFTAAVCRWPGYTVLQCKALMPYSEKV